MLESSFINFFKKINNYIIYGSIIHLFINSSISVVIIVQFKQICIFSSLPDFTIVYVKSLFIFPNKVSASSIINNFTFVFYTLMLQISLLEILRLGNTGYLKYNKFG